MGQLLSQPVTTKHSEQYENEQFNIGMSCMQGWRVSMEDAHTVAISIPGKPNDSFFGVYDGHGGSKVAEYTASRLLDIILKNPRYDTNTPESLVSSFLAADDAMLRARELHDDNSGATAVTCLIKNGKLYCANTGDSRAIASQGGNAVQLSFDHKPTDEIEYNRIIKAGGWVEFNRVNGNLALSRAFGDFEFKRNGMLRPEEQIITAMPDVITKDITPDYEFILMACDGIWDVVSIQEALEFCRVRIANGTAPVQICEELLTRCLAPDCQMSGIGCDNMTAILICFLHGGTYAQLSKNCTKAPGGSRSSTVSPRKKSHPVVKK